MAARFLVDLTGLPSEASFHAVVHAAYRAAKHEIVGLIVDPPHKGLVDQSLDRVVARLGIDFQGVLFLEASRDLNSRKWNGDSPSRTHVANSGLPQPVAEVVYSRARLGELASPWSRHRERITELMRKDR